MPHLRLGFAFDLDQRPVDEVVGDFAEARLIQTGSSEKRVPIHGAATDLAKQSLAAYERGYFGARFAEVAIYRDQKLRKLGGEGTVTGCSWFFRVSPPTRPAPP